MAFIQSSDAAKEMRTQKVSQHLSHQEQTLSRLWWEEVSTTFMRRFARSAGLALAY